MIRDRGKIKWQSAFFMPEHVKMLNDIHEEGNKQKKPQLDEREAELISIIVMESLNYSLPVKVTTWKDGYFFEQYGIVNKLDQLMKYLLLEKDKDMIRIMINCITAVERA